MDMASDYSLPATIATMLTPELHADILRFMKSHRWAVEATATPGARPQAALVGFAVTPQLEVVFDTLTSTRKAANLRENPRVALVIGGPEGLANDVRKRANQSWSLSALTFPHGMVRVIVVEQLYRAWTILQGHPYHKV